MKGVARIRLYVDAPLGAEQCVHLTAAQAHYLFAVMRLAEGGRVALFNGRDGEWQAEVLAAGRRAGTLRCREQSAPLRLPPDLWLLFAPLKKARTDFIVEKATELGVRHILPVSTAFTNAERLRRDRLQAHAVEAAEQCGATFVPEVADLCALPRLLEGWDPARRILWADEGLAGFVPRDTPPGTAPPPAPPATAPPRPAPSPPDAGSPDPAPAPPAPSTPDRSDPAAPGPGREASTPTYPATPAASAAPDAAATSPGAPWAILIGPEGGFSEAERATLSALTFVTPRRLGPRILRADTAAVAALTWWQITHGDWSAAWA